jgi:hypothetical protein
VIGGIIMPGNGTSGTLPQYTLVDSDPAELEIRPLPRGNVLPGFTGAVGSYSIDSPVLSTNVVTVGEPVKLRVRVRGEGNLARLVPPTPPNARDWQVFSATTEQVIPQIVQAQGFVNFDYLLIPLDDHTRSTPPFAFSAFNPERGAYEDLTIPPLSITVLAGTTTPADLQTLIQAQNTETEPEKEPVLSGLASAPGLSGGLVPVQTRPWFPLLHLAPGSALLALWFWDRRRRFLEQHPDVVLRRRALRALRRERRLLKRVAHARDSASFATVSVNAMRVAVAPFYPAEPRALVGADVITMLPEAERSGRVGQTVRQVFASVDASRFGVASPDNRNLLELEPEIDGVLDRLETRLCT